MDGTTRGVVVTTFCMGGAVIAFTIYLLQQVLPELRARDEDPEPPITQTPARDEARDAPEPAPRRSLWARVVRRLAGEP